MSWSPMASPAASAAPACSSTMANARHAKATRRGTTPRRIDTTWPRRDTPDHVDGEAHPEGVHALRGRDHQRVSGGQTIASGQAASSRRRGAGQLEVERPATLLNARRAARTRQNRARRFEEMGRRHGQQRQRRRIADSLTAAPAALPESVARRRRRRVWRRARLPKSAKLIRHAVRRGYSRLGAPGRSWPRRRRRRRRPRRPRPPARRRSRRRSPGCRRPWSARLSSASASRPSAATATSSAAAWPRKACW